MDPLNLSASIIAVLTLGATVVQYLNNIKDAASDRQSILNEVVFTTGLLRVFQDLVKERDRWSATVASLTIPNGPLEQLTRTLQRLEVLLRPASGVKKAAKTILWPIKKEEIKDILCALERQKTLFSLAIQNDHV